MKRLPANTKSFQMQMHRILTCVFANAHKSGFSICLVLAFVLVFEMNLFLHYYSLGRWPSLIILIVILIRSECGGIQMPSGIFSHSHSGGHAPVNLSLSHFPSIVKVTLPLKHSQKLQVTFANVTQTSKEIWRHLIANVLFFPFFCNPNYLSYKDHSLLQSDCNGRLGNQLSIYATLWVRCVIIYIF